MKSEPAHGGAREGAGRKALPDSERRANVTVKLLPGADTALDELANKAASSKGGIIEWLTLSPGAEKARKACITEAAQFTRRQPMQKESGAAGYSRAALRLAVKRKLTQAGQ